jgi:hypothetical protein
MASKDIKVIVVEIDGVEVDEREEYKLHSEDCDFVGAEFTATKAQQAIIEAKEGFPKKSGVVSGTSFAGNPKTYAVTFTTAFADTNYNVKIVGEDARTWTYESKTTSGFVINANANQAFTGEVSWTATENGEHG